MASFLNGIGSFMQAGASMGGAMTQSQALEAQGKYQKQQAETNARLAEMQAEDSIKRGDKAAGRYKASVSQAIGKQRAALAAQGIDVNSGSASEVQAETARIGTEDVMTIKNNAWREAWGFKVSALNSRSEGAMAELAGKNAADATLLSGGLAALGHVAKGGYEFFGNTKSSGGGTPIERPKVASAGSSFGGSRSRYI